LGGFVGWVKPGKSGPVHDSSGSQIAENNDIVAGVNHDSQLSFTPGTTGTYYLDARAFGDNLTGTYRIGVSAASPSDDFRDSLTDATAPFGQIGVGGSSTGNLEVAGDRDWFSISLNAGTAYVISLQGAQAGGGTLEDPYLRFHDHTGALLAQNDDIALDTNLDSQLTFLITTTDTYYIEAGAFDDSYTGTYKVGINEAACFCRGTLILTEHGEVAVEELGVGERVVTLSGTLKSIRWIGFGRDLVTGKNSLARPIVVRRDALADNVPRRDLYLTHGHALYLDGVHGRPRPASRRRRRAVRPGIGRVRRLYLRADRPARRDAPAVLAQCRPLARRPQPARASATRHRAPADHPPTTGGDDLP
jgi:Hint domain/Bacterial pre-peptidase C-terminal domain